MKRYPLTMCGTIHSSRKYLIDPNVSRGAIWNLIPLVTPQVQPALCPERQQLSKSIIAAEQRVIALHREGIDALLNCELARQRRILREINRAIAFRDSLLVVLKAHLKAHGCEAALAN